VADARVVITNALITVTAAKQNKLEKINFLTLIKLCGNISNNISAIFFSLMLSITIIVIGYNLINICSV